MKTGVNRKESTLTMMMITKKMEAPTILLETVGRLSTNMKYKEKNKKSSLKIMKTAFAWILKRKPVYTMLNFVIQ